MPFHMSWGDSFLRIEKEFWPDQIAEIQRRARKEHKDFFRDIQLEREETRASIVPFEIYGYGLALVLRQDRIWSLEVAYFPPHAKPGERIRKARRTREREERREERKRRRDGESGAKTPGGAARGGRRRAKARRAPKERPQGKDDAAQRVISAFLGALLKLYNIGETYEKFKRLRRDFAAISAHIGSARPAPLTVRQQLLRWMTPSQGECREANIAAWLHKALPPGFQWERRLFLADFLPIWLDTIVPIDSHFVRGGRSVFGELIGECEFVL